MTGIVQTSERSPGSIRILTENERAWIDFLRLLSNDGGPAPTLAAIQALRAALRTGRGSLSRS